VSGYVYLIGACVILFGVGTIWIRLRTRRIAASRPGENFDTFRASFASEEAPPEVLRSVYSKVQEWCSDAMAAFPVRAADDIGRVYRMVDEDLDDAVLEVLATCGRQLPSERELRCMRPVLTVRDFVSLVTACPRVPNPTVHRTGPATSD